MRSYSITWLLSPRGTKTIQLLCSVSYQANYLVSRLWCLSMVEKVLMIVSDPTLPSSYLNLFAGYADILPAPDQLLLLLHALGGSDIPEKLLKSVCLPQRRWDSDGEIQTVTAAEFGLPTELINMLSDQIHLSRAAKSPYIIRRALDDTTIVWSLCPDYASILSRVLHPRTADELGDTALKLICYACPPCYEGNTDWYTFVYVSKCV